MKQCYIYFLFFKEYYVKDGNDIKRTFEKRKKSTDMIKLKYPDKIPLLFFRKTTSQNILTKQKYMVTKYLIFSQVKYNIRTELKLKLIDTLIFENNNMIISDAINVEEFYDKYKNDDGFLKIVYYYKN